jgi:hypothetical protein
MAPDPSSLRSTIPSSNPKYRPLPLFLSHFLSSPLSRLVQLSPLLSVANVKVDLDGDGVQAALSPEALDLRSPHDHRCTGASGARTPSSVTAPFAFVVVVAVFQFVIEDTPL